MKKLLTLLLLCASLYTCAQKPHYNIDAEELDATTRLPKSWTFAFNPDQQKAYKASLDEETKYAGKHAIAVENIGSQAPFYAIDYIINKTFQGREIELKGYIRTENIKSGYAGLWMRIDGEQPTIAFDNMSGRGPTGNTGWKQYTIKLPYDSDAARSIHLGGLLVGDGKAWFDQLELSIDGKPIDLVPEKKIEITKASLDTAFRNTSDIKPFSLTPRIQENLTVAGQFWGFVKYHHPAIAKGDYNWDAELFRNMPKIISAPDNAGLSKVLEDWLNRLPVVQPDEKNANRPGALAISPDYGSLLNQSVLSASLTKKLIDIRESKRTNKHYYLSYYPGVGNPKFEHELSYSNIAYPDAGIRLLSLYRYWTMINYFFPYKDVIGRDWNEVLAASVPEFVNAKDTREYLLATLKLIAGIHDTHANIWSQHAAIEEFKGKFKLPFNAEFVENKLVVTAYTYGDTLNVKQNFQIGDIITEINGKPVDELIKTYLPYTAASNYDTQLRDLPYGYLLRGQSPSFSVTLLRDGKKILQNTQGLQSSFYYKSAQPDQSGFKLLENKIGYVYPGRYKNSDLPAIKELFKDTRGIIVDMRCYPSEFMPFTFGNYIKSLNTPFVKFSSSASDRPGRFTFTKV